MKTETIALIGVGGVVTVFVLAATLKKKGTGLAALTGRSVRELSPAAVKAETDAAPYGRDAQGAPYANYGEWSAANPVRNPVGGFKKYKVAPADSYLQVAARFNTPEGGTITLVKLNPSLTTRTPKYSLTPNESITVPAGVDRGSKRGAMGTVY